MAQRLLVASNAAEALRRNIVEEQQLYNQFLNAVRTIMQPIQSAIAIVQVYPPILHATFKHSYVAFRWPLYAVPSLQLQPSCCHCGRVIMLMPHIALAACLIERI